MEAVHFFIAASELVRIGIPHGLECLDLVNQVLVCDKKRDILRLVLRKSSRLSRIFVEVEES